MRGIWLVSILFALGCTEKIRVRDAGQPPGGGGGGTVDAGQPPVSADAGEPQNCKRQVGDAFNILSPAGENRFAGIRKLAFDGAGNLHVLNIVGPSPFTAYVHIFDSDNQLLRVVGRDVIDAVQGMTVAQDGTMFVIEYNADVGSAPEVIEMDTMGVERRRWVPNAQRTAWSIQVADDGDVFVGGFTVDVYSSTGTFKRTIGVEGADQGNMQIATDIAFGPAGHVWVADLFRNNIHQWDVMTGGHILEFGGRGNGEPGTFDNDGVPVDDFFGPERLAFDSNGNIYAPDPANARVQKLSRQGSFLGALDFAGSTVIGSVAVHPVTGYVYVARRTEIDIWCPI